MGIQTVFKRYEIKYLLTREQKELLLKRMEPYMRLDRYGHSTIRNLYYDTDRYRLIRHSCEKPVYKEKLRVRSYKRVTTPGETVFVELKKKYDSVVYKRRIALPMQDAMGFLSGEPLPANEFIPARERQIRDEIDYFCRYYETLQPRVFLSYEREAFYEIGGGDFRVTFDENILARTDGLSLSEEPGGVSLLDDAFVLMELKVSGGIPLWMTKFLTEQRIYKTSFSKYGRAYCDFISRGIDIRMHQNEKGALKYVC